MKKPSVRKIIIFMFAFLMLVLSACGEKHTHSYTVISVSPSDCSSSGLEIVLCTGCGDKLYQKIPPLGHDYSEKIIPPSCDTEGYTLYTCLNCGDCYKSDFVSAHGHSFVTEKTEATCQSDGSIREICENCGFINGEEIIPATDHVFTDTIVSPTCSSEGYTFHECKNCGHSYTDGYTSRTAHNYVLTERKDPAGDTDGYELYSCTYCGNSYKTTLSVSNHDYAEQITLPATCTTDGIKTFYCRDCGKSYTETISALGHDYVSSILIEPSCMAEGIIEFKCSRCPSSYREQLAKISHNFGEWQKATDPTSESEGRLRRYCATPGCMHYEYFTLPALSEKDYDCGILLEPTFEDEGAAYYIYEKDGQYFSFEEIIPKLESELIYELDDGSSTCVVTGVKSGKAEVVVPAYYGKYKVTQIRPFAFYGSNAEKVTVHAAKICDDAFRNCALKEIVIGDEVTEIGKNAFSGCDLLAKADFPESGNWFVESPDGEISLDISDAAECAVYLRDKYVYYIFKRY